MAFTIRGLFLQNSGEASVVDPSPEDTSGEDLADRHPPRINKTIKNFRYAYENDATVRGILINNATTANNRYYIKCDDPNAKAWIKQKVKEWKLERVMTQTLIRAQRDGHCFIEKGFFDGSIQIRFLAYDADKYKMKVIRDPLTDHILGYMQHGPASVDPTGWEEKKFDDINDEGDEVDTPYQADQVIFPVLIEEKGRGDSLLSVILDNVDDKKTFERFMRSAAHKAGQLIGVTIGNERISTKDVPKSFVTKLLKVFRSPIEKDVAVVPDGVNLDTIGDSQLPDLPGYIKYHRSEIFLALQSPESLFSTESSNRATAEVQADDSTGYKVFITFLRDFLKNYFEKELIDHELQLKGFSNSVGKCEIIFDEEEKLEPLSPDSKVAEEIGEKGFEEIDSATEPATQTITKTGEVTASGAA